MRSSGLEEAQAGNKTAGRNINNLYYADDTTLMAKSKEELKSLDEGERAEWKGWFKMQHSKNQDHGMRSHHFIVNRWGNGDRLYFWGAPKSPQMVTAARKLKNACSLEEKLGKT